jgi:hypothetical protein
MKRSTKMALFAVLLAAVLLMTAVPALAASVDPITVPGNPKLCEGGYKIDPVPLGQSSYTHTLADGTVVGITIDVYSTDMGPMMDFEVTGAPVYQVVAKGGSGGANVYVYDPAVYEDTGLHCPLNPSGKYADFSHIDFCFGTPGGGGDSGALSGSKWYDRDMDGVWDECEPALACWKVSLFKMGESDYEWVADACTDANGYYEFTSLAPGTYKIVEGIAGSPWVQTYPYDPNYYDAIVLTPNLRVDELDFGNVCVRCVKGYTMGFWSNKNGKAVLTANAGTLYATTGYNAVADIQALFRSAANAVDMCVMLEAQRVAHVLNVAYMDADYAGTGVIIDGVLYEYDAVMADFAAFDCAEASRCEAEWYKDFFDGLNNSWFTLVEWDPCCVPDFGCCD